MGTKHEILQRRKGLEKGNGEGKSKATGDIFMKVKAIIKTVGGSIYIHVPKFMNLDKYEELKEKIKNKKTVEISIGEAVGDKL